MGTNGAAAGYIWYPGVWYANSDPNTFPYGNITNTVSSVVNLAWMQSQNQVSSYQPTSMTQMTTVSNDGTRTVRTFRNGYFEARMKWTVTPGAWPAFWLLPKQQIINAHNNVSIYDYGELDIFEGDGTTPSTFYGTLHHWRYDKNQNPTDYQYESQTPTTNAFLIPTNNNDFSQWHTYGMLWTAPAAGAKTGTVTWYYDGVQVGPTTSTFQIMESQDYYLIFDIFVPSTTCFMNCSMSGNIPNVTAATLNLQVDYIRVWQK